MNDIFPERLPEFDGHELVVRLQDKLAGLHGFISFHRKRGKYPCFGATRFSIYRDEMSALRDSLRLARTMSYKSALAGLPYGGAKAVLIDRLRSAGMRKRALAAYARRLRYFGTSFITGTDAGMNRSDLAALKKISDNVVGFSCNPARMTAQGIFLGIQAALKERFGDDNCAGRRFAVQGIGKVGSELIKLLYPLAERIFVTDARKETVRDMCRRYPRLIPVSSQRIYSLEVDVFSPCALHGSLNPQSVKVLRCTTIVGGANNQLDTPDIGDRLHQRGILYAPDYVVNAGGLIAVSDEFSNRGVFDEKRALKSIDRISATLADVFAAARVQKKAPFRIADAMAENIIG